MKPDAAPRQNASPPPPRARIVPRGHDDKFDIKRSGGHRKPSDFYVWMLGARWRQLFEIIALVYIAGNVLFALIYLAIGDGIKNARSGSFADAFFFSVQTMSTIGYGSMSPVGLAANMVVSVEVLTGFMFFALVTGLVFSKFSRPTARVMFSNLAVIAPFDGHPHLMVRLANERANGIVNANLQMVLLRKTISPEGHMMRRFYDMPLLRKRVPVLQLTWTVMHKIDEKSPLFNATPEMLKEWDAEILVSLVGMDETFAQNVHARWSYLPDDIIANANFVDVIKRREEDNGIDIDFTHFHETRPLSASPESDEVIE